LKELPAMLLQKKAADFALAAGIVALSIAISPIGIRVATGLLDLSPRVTAVSLTFVVFLLILAGAVLAKGRARHALFYLLVWSFPLALLAAVEVSAIAIHLADRIAPIEDLSILADKNHWPAHLMSLGRKVTTDELPLYRPWQGDGISINQLGLRTSLPSPKKPGEWRVAVTGGSTVFGWRVLDADTIPVQLQKALRRQGHSNVTVYNFGIDAITITEELLLLKRFQEPYAIDHVIFYTGANETTNNYLSYAAPQERFAGPFNGINAFELIKVVSRLMAKLADPSPSLLARLDNEVLPGLARQNSLRNGLIEADAYCRALTIRCDFILQPVLLRRKQPRGPEIPLARTLAHVYPRYGETFATMYRSALNTGLPILDWSDLFDRSADPYFFDAAHVNEAGNRLAAERIAAIIASVVNRPSN
jgi:lysophospholipase L1-like esterase